MKSNFCSQWSRSWHRTSRQEKVEEGGTDVDRTITIESRRRKQPPLTCKLISLSPVSLLQVVTWDWIRCRHSPTDSLVCTTSSRSTTPPPPPPPALLMLSSPAFYVGPLTKVERAHLFSHKSYRSKAHPRLEMDATPISQVMSVSINGKYSLLWIEPFPILIHFLNSSTPNQWPESVDRSETPTQAQLHWSHLETIRINYEVIVSSLNDIFKYRSHPIRFLPVPASYNPTTTE